MRLLICGDREWTNRALIRKWITLFDPAVVIHGAARGADKIAGEEATDLEVECIMSFPAKWKKEKKAAGPIRNSRMLKMGQPTFVLAFHNNIETSRGTKDMLTKAEAAGIETKLVTE